MKITMHYIVRVLVLIVLTSCSTADKDLADEVAVTEPMERWEVVERVGMALESPDISSDEKREFLQKFKINLDQRADLDLKKQKLVTLLVDKAVPGDLSEEKARKILDEIETVEDTLVDLRMDMLKELKIFLQDKLDDETRNRLANETMGVYD